MKKALLAAVAMLITTAGFSQGKYLTKEGYIKFYSHTPIEDITAELNNAASIIDAESGEVIVTLKMTDFDFEKKLMEEHFNENYVESETYPKSSFKGQIVNNSDVDYSKNGTYSVEVKGDLTIHGVTNKIESFGTIDVKGSEVTAVASFIVEPADYKIEIPKIVREKIAKEVEVTVQLKYAPMK